MNLFLMGYKLASLPVAAVLPAVKLASALSGRWQELWPRVGLYRNLAPAEPGPRVWLQAVSVGELMVARQIALAIKETAPLVQLTITTSTAKGMERAQDIIGELAQVAAFPLDVPWATIAATRKIKPQVYASLETELWPGLTAHLKARGCECLLLNGRLSPRSFPAYRRVRALLRPTLQSLSVLSMISEADAQRVLALGARPESVRVDGNAKYAGLNERTKQKARPELAASLATAGRPLLVAGSVRSGEEAPVLKAFGQVLAKHPQALLAAVPRHPEKAPRWLAAAKESGLKAQLFSQLSPSAPRAHDTQVVVVDLMGVLMELYSLAASVFVGASLVNLGGQNPMEPAAWAKPVCFGPDMADFMDGAQALLQAKAAVQVNDAGGLALAWLHDLADPEAAAQRGSAGQAVVERWSVSARTAARLVVEALQKKGAL